MQYVPQSCRKERKRRNNVYQLHSNNIHQLYNTVTGHYVNMLNLNWHLLLRSFSIAL